MKVKCAICEKINNLDDDSILAKRLRNHPINTYLCDKCNERITKNTNKRIATGNFNLYRAKQTKDRL